MLEHSLKRAIYVCVSYTQFVIVFRQCQRCAALYNDKPFRSGDQLQPMNCRPCQCHGHALSCHYDVTADDQPDEHYRGGGGVCDDCGNNTTGEVLQVNLSETAWPSAWSNTLSLVREELWAVYQWLFQARGIWPHITQRVSAMRM